MWAKLHGLTLQEGEAESDFAGKGGSDVNQTLEVTYGVRQKDNIITEKEALKEGPCTRYLKADDRPPQSEHQVIDDDGEQHWA